MAVIDALPGATVEIEVDGSTLKEYEDASIKGNERTLTRYVESTSGKEFKITCTLAPDFEFKGNCIAFYFYADGTRIDWLFILDSSRSLSITCEGKDPGDGHIRKFRFADLETVDDDKMKHSERDKMDSLGTIEVRCVHGTATPSSPEPKKSTKPQVFEHAGELVMSPQSRVVPSNQSKENPKSGQEPLGIVSEKAIKGRAISHTIDFAEVTPPRPASVRQASAPVKSKVKTVLKARKPKPKPKPRALSPEPTLYTVRALSSLPDPAATFVFCYRSFASLKSMLIIPRTPTPPPLEERDVETCSFDEMREIQRRLREFEAQRQSQVKIKREKDSSEPHPRKLARPRQGDTQLEIGENGSVREQSTTGLADKEIIELD